MESRGAQAGLDLLHDGQRPLEQPVDATVHGQAQAAKPRLAADGQLVAGASLRLEGPVALGALQQPLASAAKAQIAGAQHLLHQAANGHAKPNLLLGHRQATPLGVPSLDRAGKNCYTRPVQGFFSRTLPNSIRRAADGSQ